MSQETTNRADRIGSILSLVHDPEFIKFELLQEAPSIFNAVGRTHTETWHSAMLGWLLDPKGSHGLGDYPLMRFLLLLKQQDTLSPKLRGIDFDALIINGDFSNARVRPNEREREEVTVEGVGRFDVFADEIELDQMLNTICPKVQILVEIKVRDRIKQQQCRRYIEHVHLRRKVGVLVLPVFVAPTERLLGTSTELFGDEDWIKLDFQNIYDEVIEPCLQRSGITPFGKSILVEYVKTLKFRISGASPMITTQKERELVDALYEKHELAIDALIDILKEEHENIEPHAIGTTTPLMPLKVKVNDVLLEAPTVQMLYEQALKFLVEGHYLEQIELPFATGTKRYLIAKAKTHPSGRPFRVPVEFGGYFIEAHKARDVAIRDLFRLFEACGLNPQRVE